MRGPNKYHLKLKRFFFNVMISVYNVCLFLNFRAAMEPDRTWEWVAPKLVMYGGGAKATFEPKPNSSIVRFVATKKINIPGQHCVRIY